VKKLRREGGSREEEGEPSRDGENLGGRRGGSGGGIVGQAGGLVRLEGEKGLQKKLAKGGIQDAKDWVYKKKLRRIQELVVGDSLEVHKKKVKKDIGGRHLS